MDFHLVVSAFCRVEGQKLIEIWLMIESKQTMTIALMVSLVPVMRMRLMPVMHSSSL